MLAEALLCIIAILAFVATSLLQRYLSKLEKNPKKDDIQKEIPSNSVNIQTAEKTGGLTKRKRDGEKSEEVRGLNINDTVPQIQKQIEETIILNVQTEKNRPEIVNQKTDDKYQQQKEEAKEVQDASDDETKSQSTTSKDVGGDFKDEQDREEADSDKMEEEQDNEREKEDEEKDREAEERNNEIEKEQEKEIEKEEPEREVETSKDLAQNTVNEVEREKPANPPLFKMQSAPALKRATSNSALAEKMRLAVTRQASQQAVFRQQFMDKLKNK